MSKSTIVRLTAILVAIVGAYILLNSTLWGLSAVSSIVRANGGSLGGEFTLSAVHNGTGAAYRVLGGILLGVGLFRALDTPKNN